MPTEERLAPRNGLPDRGPASRLGTRPALRATPGGPAPYRERQLTAEEVFPGPEAPPTIKAAEFLTPTGPTPLGAPPTAPEGTAPTPQLPIPSSFEELLYHVVLVNSAREVPVIVQQTIAAGASGSTTVSIPENRVDVARKFREAGDGSVTYRVEVDGAGRTAIPDHRITGGERTFARYYEKYTSVIVTFTNNDVVNTALLQLEWVSVQVDPSKWLQYRENMKAWSRLLGITE